MGKGAGGAGRMTSVRAIRAGIATAQAEGKPYFFFRGHGGQEAVIKALSIGPIALGRLTRADVERMAKY